jgi:hypothetical protein
MGRRESLRQGRPGVASLVKEDSAALVTRSSCGRIARRASSTCGLCDVLRGIGVAVEIGTIPTKHAGGSVFDTEFVMKGLIPRELSQDFHEALNPPNRGISRAPTWDILEEGGPFRPDHQGSPLR